ncbi:MAG: hypothetical protein M0Q40_11340 [Limnochordia bacterium]|nr:hypothetical protein [Limnochordia bacterium]MDD4518552.1 hypothetical protein [Limnochordia bacterium]
MSKESVSLLWPSGFGSDGRDAKLPTQFIVDLDLDKIVSAMSVDLRNKEQIRRILYHPCSDAQVIAYRLAVLDDFLNLPRLVSKLKEMSPSIRRFVSLKNPRHTKGDHPLKQIGWRFEVLDQYVLCMQRLQTVLAMFRDDMQSEGLKRLSDYATKTVCGEEFQALKQELPVLRARFQSISSVTIGLNLNSELRPVEATLLAINSEPFEPKSFMARFRGLVDGNTCPSVFYSLLRKPDLEHALFRDLDSVFKDALMPVNSILSRFTSINSEFFRHLEIELDFYIGATKLIDYLRAAGMPMCRPEVAPKESRVTDIKENYNINLALDLLSANPVRNVDQEIVKNEVSMGPRGRILIITGPNQGGKTTYLRSIGLSHVLFQAGIFVPGTRARISPVDWIYTHFAEPETTDNKEGRLSAESRRLAQIFQTATRYSLILLNESLASTSPGESLYMTLDIMGAIRFLGARAAFATHLHELAARVDEINVQVPGDSRLVSLVAGLAFDGHSVAKRTYRIVAAPPAGMSFAKDIAEAYGISFEQLCDVLRARKVVDAEFPAKEVPRNTPKGRF